MFSRVAVWTVWLGGLIVASPVLTNSVCGAVQLTELLAPDATFEIDSLHFDQFSYTADGLMPSPSGVLVDAVTDANGNVGIRVTGGFSDTPDHPGPSSLELAYRVSTTDGTGLAGASLAGNPAIIGQGSITITESSDQFATSLFVFDSSTDGTSLLDSVPLDGQSTSLDVLLSLQADAVEQGATASFIDQTFAQTDEVIPEPTSLAIWIGTLIMGLISAGWFRLG